MHHPFLRTVIHVILLLLSSFVLCEGRHAVIFDIDGTLTPDLFQIGHWLVRKKSKDAVEAYLDLGYEVVLLTARSQRLQWYTRAVLSMWGFPLEDLTAMVFAPHALVNEEATREYKRMAIQNMTEVLGLEFQYAYGDSTTDFLAYGDAGIDSSRVFATKRLTRSTCMPGNWTECLVDYTDHLMYIEELPLAL
ncbi:LNS2 (Lipin/Ned1/Smp2) [Seminavis robusta]|uniref:LNS2 (Lipin/Ned1/Smp2) n=1 Tax=Seminavis robusta TaxID=568900 RepID=A0A9N8DT70_9STRA|nr:LNS2 (Lipin/Ned1/Smp2) [Seminavis robusta]|eukprot:Sro324_g117640.1 LNS2 (Lipin/Ned1/Smp2) (192) ;mRNA; r:62261-62836